MGNKIQLITDIDCAEIDKSADGYILPDESFRTEEILQQIDGSYVVQDNTISREELYKNKLYLCALGDRMIEWYGERINAYYGVQFSDAQWKILLGAPFYYILEDVHACYLSSKRCPFDTYVSYKYDINVWPEVKTVTDLGCYLSGRNLRYRYFSWKYAMMFRLLEMPVRCVDRAISRQFSTQEEYIYQKRLYQKQALMVRLLRGLRDPRRVGRWAVRQLTHDSKSDVDINQWDLHGSVLAINSRLPAEIEQEIAERSGGDITFFDYLPFKTLENSISDVPIDYHLRQRVIADFPFQNEFERVAQEFIRTLFPSILLEGFMKLYSLAGDITRTWNVRKIYHGSMQGYPLIAMCLALAKGRNGALICSIQHAVACPCQFVRGWHEYHFQDRFINWGWEPVDLPFQNIRRVSMSRLPRRENVSAGFLPTRKDKILLVVDEQAMLWHFDGVKTGGYLDELKAFVSGLTDENRKKLTVRLRWGFELQAFRSWCHAHYPMVQFESMRVDGVLSKSLLKHELVVCSTTYMSAHIEALILGKPTVMFEGTKAIPNPCLIPHYNAMRECGLLCGSGAEMAETINKHKNFSEWTADEKTARIISEYMNEVAGVEKNTADVWYTEMSGD